MCGPTLIPLSTEARAAFQSQMVKWHEKLDDLDDDDSRNLHRLHEAITAAKNGSWDSLHEIIFAADHGLSYPRLPDSYINSVPEPRGYGILHQLAWWGDVEQYKALVAKGPH